MHDGIELSHWINFLNRNGSAWMYTVMYIKLVACSVSQGECDVYALS